MIIRIFNFADKNLVKEDDYLRVVEEKKVYKENLNRVQKHLQVKDEEIKNKIKQSVMLWKY